MIEKGELWVARLPLKPLLEEIPIHAQNREDKQGPGW
jgi:hypothetical protein